MLIPEWLILVSIFLVFCLGYVVAYLVQSHKLNQLKQELATTHSKLELTEHQIHSQKQIEKTFESLSKNLLNSQQATQRQLTQNQLESLLKPFKTEIQQFRQRLEQTRDSDIKERTQFTEKIHQLAQLNQQMSADAQALTEALTGKNQSQGSWGELVLERILEISGLTQGREYQTQLTVEAADGSKIRPDVVVYLPNQRKVIIDSKVSLTAYHRYCNSQQEDTRVLALKQHISSIEGHIQNLSKKEYYKSPDLAGLDFVLMFIPIENALAQANIVATDLVDKALKQRIIIVTPNTLFSVLRIIDTQWKVNAQSRNAQKIAAQGTKLYEQLSRFIDDLEKVGKTINQSQKSYEQAYHRLATQRGNVLQEAEKLKQLGISSNKNINISNQDNFAILNDK